MEARAQAVQAENVTVLEGGTAQISCRLQNYDGSIVVIQNPRRQTLFFNGTRALASQVSQGEISGPPSGCLGGQEKGTGLHLSPGVGAPRWLQTSARLTPLRSALVLLRKHVCIRSTHSSVPSFRGHQVMHKQTLLRKAPCWPLLAKKQEPTAPAPHLRVLEELSHRTLSSISMNRASAALTNKLKGVERSSSPVSFLCVAASISLPFN
ncbi:hypothetical protein DNTS_021609 [Danionella cerebrum]|uniref:Uncharacterized protein n=1 Tax=Danionella cerebrum TaxID=2873325 RepID=A0A553QXM9_9TELE|nr:hypothetical protein DNTS_021609 [Danionella translucida]